MVDGDGWLTPCAGRSDPVYGTVPLIWKSWWASGPVWMGVEYFASLRIDFQTTQPIVSHYTDYYSSLQYKNDHRETGCKPVWTL